MKSIKTDKVAVENTFSKMRQISSHYLEPGEKQRKQAYAALESQFEANLRQAVQQQMGASALEIRIDVEKQPQFQEEWHKLLAQLYS